MPIYEYECENCGTRFERFQSIRDEPIRQCPECSGAVHKVLYPAGIIFKGSGWYITDSRKSTSSVVAGETQTSDNASKNQSNGGAAKTETKSATRETSAASKAESQAASK